MTNRGFQTSKIEVGDYRLGGAYSLKGATIVPDGQWTKWLSPPENQSREGFEPNACVSYAIKHAVETLQRQEFGDVGEYSARWLAWATGTEQKHGNDPGTVCTFLGKNGDVYDADWSYPTPATDFYKTPPQTLYTLAKVFIAKYKYDNQWVPATPDAMMDALTRSPLTAAGFAWHQNSNGLYDWPNGALPDHYFEIYGYSRNNYWLVCDTYSDGTGSVLKELVWDYPFIQIKEHTIHANVSVPSYFAKFVQWLRQICGLDGPTFGASRSPEWPRVRATHLLKEPACQLCGGIKGLQVHHIRPFHVHPEFELLDSNLITLCTGNNTINCHVRFGHLDNFKDKWNPNIREDCRVWKARFDAVKEQEVFPLEIDTAV